jgi:hypothetical protein
MEQLKPIPPRTAKRNGEGDREAVEGAAAAAELWPSPPPPRCAWSPSPALQGRKIPYFAVAGAGGLISAIVALGPTMPASLAAGLGSLGVAATDPYFRTS